MSRTSNYVRNTHRQAATRAIRIDGGLGFASGTRFDLLALEPVGRALANAFLDQRVGKGGGSLRNWLKGWLNSTHVPGWSESLLTALSPEYPTPSECQIVKSRVLDTSTDSSAKRRQLARAIGRPAKLPDIESVIVTRLRAAGNHQQADEVIAARAFGAVLDRARDATAEITRLVESGRGSVPIMQLVHDPKLRKALSALKSAASNFRSKADLAKVAEPTSTAFCDAIVKAKDDSDAIRVLVPRVGEVLLLAADSVMRGPLFRTVDRSQTPDRLEDSVASIEPDFTGRTFRIANLHALLRDVAQRGEA